MYKKVPKRKKIYKKFLYAFSKIFLKPIDSIFNLTLRANFLERFLQLHRQNYKICKNKLYFIHIPKTGGTTFHQILQKNLKTKLFNFNYPYNYDFNTHNPLPKNINLKNKNFVTILRNPLNRVYSFYIDQLRNKKGRYHNLAKKGLKNFCDKCWESNNLYCRYFSGDLHLASKIYFEKAKKNLKDFNDVLIFENLNQEINNYIKKYNFKKKWLTKNKKKYSPPSQENLQIIKKYNANDLRLYKFILNLKKVIEKY